MPRGGFEGDSNYHDNYTGLQAKKQEQFRPTEQLKVGGAFEGGSSYLADYQNRGNAVRAERIPLPRNQILP